MECGVKTLFRKDRWVALVLVLFCAAMTALLIFNEYFPGMSFFRQVPPSLLAERFLKNESTSALKLSWKGEPLGFWMLRVSPGQQLLLNASGQMAIPVLGEKHKLRVEMDCRLKPNHDVETIRFRGRFQETAFDLSADTAQDKGKVEVRGPEIDEKREFVLSEIAKQGGQLLSGRVPGLPENAAVPAPQKWMETFNKVQWNASTTRISRQGDWMDAYLLDVRPDPHTWVKVWMSPTGEILKVESSFGFNALNEDFFRGSATNSDNRL